MRQIRKIISRVRDGKIINQIPQLFSSQRFKLDRKFNIIGDILLNQNDL